MPTQAAMNASKKAESLGLDAKDLGKVKKQLQKADLKSLLDGELISEAIEIISNDHAEHLVLDILSIHLTLYRQLRYVFESTQSNACQHIADLVHFRLAPLFSPSQIIGGIFLKCLVSSVRATNLRATDALAAAGRMVDVLPPPSSSSSSPSNMLVPLFIHACTPNIPGRSDMTLMNAILPHIPIISVPDNLLDKLKVDFDSFDAASLRCAIISNILLQRAEELEEEDVRCRIILEPLLPLFDENIQPPGTILNLTRYLLPSLFAAEPILPKRLLDHLSSKQAEDRFSGWISVASLGVSAGHLDITDLPQAELADAISHSDDSIRLRAFQLLAGPKDILRKDILSLIKQSFQYNAILASAGNRSEFSSAVHALLKKAKETTDITNKTHGEGDTRVVLASQFRSWLLDGFIDPGMAVACRYPVVQAILALSVLKLYLDIFGQEVGVHAAVFTRQRVGSLFVCQASEFTEVRSRTRAILERSKVPLPGYETFDSPSTRLLVDSCFKSIDHPRKTQAEAGKSALCIVFQRLLLNDGSTSEAVAFVEDLIRRLEERLKASEQDLVKGMSEMPLHGSIAAIRDVIGCVRLVNEKEQSAWRATLHRLVQLVDRTWDATRSVISLAPSKKPDEDRPDHEIARAYEILGGREDEEEDEAMDHTNLLSGCWRATKEAGELLSTLIRLPIRQNGPSQVIWSVDEVDEAGKRFLTWMHEIRHRGTFSKIASAFTDMVDAVKTVDILKPLCYSWLQHELEIITTDSLSTTRRSAALPYSVLAIVAYDAKLLDIAFEALNELASVENTASSDITKIHAFNILKIVLLDARQAKLLDRYFERAVMTALYAFSSPNWNVRNVGLILFSTIVHRTLAPGRGTQDFFASKSNLATRQTMANWNAKYPAVIPYITHTLTDLSRSPETAGAHSPLFPILIIIRSLRWSPKGETLAGRLIPVVQNLLGSKEWQVRMVSAQALSSLLSPDQAVVLLQGSAMTLSEDANARHGELLLNRHLIAEVVDWSVINTASKERVRDRILDIIKQCDESQRSLVVKAALDLAASYLEVGKGTSALTTATTDLARRVLHGDGKTPGVSMASSSASAILCEHVSDERQTILSFLTSTSEDLHLDALTRLDQGSKFDPEILRALIRLIQGETALAVKIAALELLPGAELDVAQSDSPSEVDWQECATYVLDLAKIAKSVPLREAALAASGWAVSQCHDLKMAGSTNQTAVPMLEKILALTSVASEIEQSQPSRYASLQAIKSLGSAFYPQSSIAMAEEMLVGYHRLILRLLQDDDETIRFESSDVVSHALGVSRMVCQKRALELEWEYIGLRAQSDPGNPWRDLLWAAVMDKESFESDLIRFRQQAAKGEVLFEVEPPNLFRDSLVDQTLASREMVKLDLVNLTPEQQTQLEGQISLGEKIVEGEEFSPIVIKYDLKRKMRQRLNAWKSLSSRI